MEDNGGFVLWVCFVGLSICTVWLVLLGVVLVVVRFVVRATIK